MKVVLICVLLTASAAYGHVFPASISEKGAAEKDCDEVGCLAACYPLIGDCHVHQQCVCRTRHPQMTTSSPASDSRTFLEAFSQARSIRMKRKSLYSCELSQCRASCWLTGRAFGGFCAYNVCNCNYVSQGDINNNLWTVT